MKNVLIFMALLAVGGAFFTDTFQSYTLRTGPSVQYPSVVLMFTDHGACSGFIVGRGLVATAGHCISPADLHQFVRFIDGVTVPYKVIAYTFTEAGFEDWAVVMADTGTRPYYEIDDSPLERRQVVTHIGHPLGTDLEYSVWGMVIGSSGYEIALGTTAIEGESGSPVIDAANRVVGILTCTGRPFPVATACTVGPLKHLVAALTEGL